MKISERVIESICGLLFLLQVLINKSLLSQESSILVMLGISLVASVFWWLILRYQEDFSPGVLISAGGIVFAFCDYLNDIGLQLPTKRAGEFLPASITMAVGFAALSFAFVGVIKLVSFLFARDEISSD